MILLRRAPPRDRERSRRSCSKLGPGVPQLLIPRKKLSSYVVATTAPPRKDPYKIMMKIVGRLLNSSFLGAWLKWTEFVKYQIFSWERARGAQRRVILGWIRRHLSIAFSTWISSHRNTQIQLLFTQVTGRWTKGALSAAWRQWKRWAVAPAPHVVLVNRFLLIAPSA